MRSSMRQWQAQAKPSCLHRDRRRTGTSKVPSKQVNELLRVVVWALQSHSLSNIM